MPDSVPADEGDIDDATSTTLAVLPDAVETTPTSVECVPRVELVEVPGWNAQADAVKIAEIPPPPVEPVSDPTLALSSELATDPLGVASDPLNPDTSVSNDQPPVGEGETPPEVPEPPTPPLPEPTEPPAPPETAESTAASLIVPAYPNSEETYTLAAEVEVLEPMTLANVSTVTMCWYKVDAVGLADGVETGPGSSDCSKLDPRYNFKMTWDEASGTVGGTTGFAVGSTVANPTNNYVNAGSQVETTPDVSSYDPAARLMTIRFAFKVSSAMSAGSDWSVSVSVALDDPTVSLAVDTRQELSVGYWGSLFTTKQAIDFGLVAPGGSSSKALVSLGTYRANSVTTYSLQGTDYYCSSDACTTLFLRGANSEASDGVDLECTLDAEPVRLGTDIRHVGTLPATGEAEADIAGMTCTLLYRGGAPLAFSEYSGPILVSISPAG